MSTKQATRTHDSVKQRLDLSVYTLFELRGGNESGPGLPTGVANAICGPMADSPAARRLQLFIASCAEGGMLTQRLLSIFCDWAELVEARFPSPQDHQERKYLSGLRRAIKYSKALVDTSEQDVDSFAVRRILHEVEELCEKMGNSWDVDHPVAYTGWTLLLVAQRIFEPQRLDSAWGHAAAILGSIALLCPEDELESDIESCADVAYCAVFGQKAMLDARGAASVALRHVANINAGTRRTDRMKKSKSRPARKERRSA